MVTAVEARTTLEGVRRLVATASDEQGLLGDVAAVVARSVPYTGAAWLSTDPATVLFTDGVVRDFAPQSCQPWFHNELSVHDVHKFRTITGRGAAVLSRDADRRRSARWTGIMAPQGLDDELRITLDDTTGTWGIVELHRPRGEPDFTAAEAALLEQVAPLVARGLRRVALARQARTATAPSGPGVVVVHDDGDAVPVTDVGAAWLELLHEPMPGGHRRTALLTVAGVARALRSEDGYRGDTRVRTRAVDGSWLTLHAQSTLEGDAVAVIIEPTRTAAIAELLARAHGLTEREQEVAMLVARGRSTAQMASELFISPHTVRDHVKAALAKVGVNSRAELVAALFEQHYAGRFFGGPTAHD